MSGNQTTTYHRLRQGRGSGCTEKQEKEKKTWDTRKQAEIITVTSSHVVQMSGIKNRLKTIV